MTVLVTGAASGLGAAMARGVAANGCNVVLVDVSSEALRDMDDDLRRQGRVGVMAVTADISAPDDVARVQQLAMRQFGRMDVLVNNAGLGQGAIKRDFLESPPRTWEITVAAWRRMIDVNVIGGFLMARAFIPAMLANRFGRVVNVTTNFDSMLRFGFAPYGGSKAAIEAHTSILAKELAGTGVTANVLIPGGPADTQMVPIVAGVDRTAFVQPEAMVAPLLWLCGPDADEFNGRRIVAGRWSPNRDWRENCAIAATEAAWPQLAGTDRVTAMAT
ncbi:MAG: SDR family oxidoreductase [Rhizobiales bacterium]|nr:SDR family oxidoreductase [Hyphomicrobiales bacterium]OJY47005.1 MAG: hypothetical protein BGP08_03050 [Rhizobiales bacterium 64-17]